MNILLVGGEGYLGVGLSRFFKNKHNVVTWDKNEDLFKLDSSILASKHIDILVNLSFVHDRKSLRYVADSATEKVNIFGAMHLAKILQRTEVSWFQISTREVFPNIYQEADVFMTEQGFRPRFFINEEANVNPKNFYGKTKLIAEYISESHSYSNVIRLGSPYTDYTNNLGGWVLQVAKSIIATGKATLTRGGKQFRDPLHTDDIGRLIEQMHTAQKFGETIHAGGGEQNLISLREFSQLVDPKVEITDADGGDYGFAYDNSKAFNLCGWSPSVLIREKIGVIAQNIRDNQYGNVIPTIE